MLPRSLFDLSGQRALVTGGSRGLGLEIATALGQAGAAVAITARRENWLAEAEASLRDAGVTTLGLSGDVAQPAQVGAIVDAILASWGGIDILVNNAGISWAAPAVDMPLEKWQAILDTNATGSFLMAQRVGREMIARGQGGAIVNVASIAGLVGTSPDVLDTVGYAASKGAVIAMTRDLAVKWGRHGIRVNAVAPGFFPTRLTAGVLEARQERIEAATPLGRIGGAGELGGVVLFLVSPAAAYVTGQILAVDGGLTAG